MKRRTLARLFSAALFTAAVAAPASAINFNFFAEDVPATAPATTVQPTTNGSVEKLQITITKIEGNVQVRPSEDQPWKRAEIGMVLDENAEFRTSLRSAVQIQIPPDQVISLDRLGT